MADQYKEDKTEKATPKRRNKAREQGNVAYSKDVALVIMLFGSIWGLYFLGPYMRDRLLFEVRNLIGHMNYPFNVNNIQGFIISVVGDLLKIIAPMLAIILFLSYFSNVVQFGHLFTTEALKPKLSKLKPKFGELKFFKKDKLVDLGSSLGKLIIIFPVVYFTIIGELDNIITLMHRTVAELFNYIAYMIFKVVLRITLMLIFLSAIDFVYRKWKYEEDLKMTKQEVKDERKNADQDPMIKGRIRSFGRDIMRKLMYAEIPKADVVITNPTHIAVAIKYDPLNMDAPKVVAKGMRLIAERIKDIARENNIPIVENKPLARILYKTVNIGGYVPPDLYRAVAEILAYVYKMNKKRMPNLTGR
ncbi:MAG: flagellar biosynthesis protein FlhB [Candidatus Auribacterota bacterium]|jgi:flagellar biosynthetic protein FlhB|nr:flagellar biosynthesis protein FlhB [Candidatus Auribacterota bacterium]